MTLSMNLQSPKTGALMDRRRRLLRLRTQKTEIVETNALNIETGDQNAYPKQLDATDTVSIMNLQPGAEYDLTAVVADAQTRLPLREGNSLAGDVITVEQTFTATEARMDIIQELSIDASNFGGRRLLCMNICTRTAS